jgi:DNA-binding transcriptional ArsR family regulator
MTTLHWDTGTAYDFIISLYVLHSPADFGLRPTWAAGVRQRLSATSRECLDDFCTFAYPPLDWLASLPAPRNVSTLLHALVGLSAAECLAKLSLNLEPAAEVQALLAAIAQRGSWSEKDQAYLGTHYRTRGAPIKPAALGRLLKAWSEAETFSQTLLEALQEYQRAFFADEELRIRAALEKGLAQARELSKRMPVEGLVEHLSRGVRLETLGAVSELTLIASYWTSPISFLIVGHAGRALMAFGVRPGSESVAPGAGAGDGLVNTLKCLADPTRLRILRFLCDAPLTQIELSKRLRLRPPTVTHHLRQLRLAGLVQVLVGAENERRYVARLEPVREIQGALLKFLEVKDMHEKEVI